MPAKVRDFAASALVKPLTVSIGRAGAASIDVVQEVEYVPQEERLNQLLTSLQKTSPPVVIFSEKRSEVDDIHEFLLLKGIQAVGIHGSKPQEERDHAIRSFRERRKDVLVATDVASKGLDFPHIKHVINFDMPADLENYVHRIGRTGRSGKIGVATTFINDKVEHMTLLDLKLLLMEAKQKIPPFLQEIKGDVLVGGTRGCSYCGGLGHRVTQCPKLENIQEKHSKNIEAAEFSKTGGNEY